MKTEFPDYDCTQLQLYETSGLAYDNLERDLADFTAKNTKYTTAFLTALRLTRTNAMQLPDQAIRDEEHQVVLGQMKDVFLPALLDDYADLKTYIIAAWPTEDPKPRLDSAGASKYPKASKENWEYAAALAQSMQTFIAANTAKLTNPGGMPATFSGKVDDDKTNFDTAYVQFKSARETTTETDAKIRANNKLYKEMMEVLTVGATSVYRNSASKQNEYRYVYLKGIISPPGSASLKVTVMQKGTNLPVADATITIQSKEGIAMMQKTNIEGIALFKNIDAEAYKVDVNIADKEKITLTKEVNTGTAARLEVLSVKEEM